MAIVFFEGFENPPPKNWTFTKDPANAYTFADAFLFGYISRWPDGNGVAMQLSATSPPATPNTAEVEFPAQTLPIYFGVALTGLQSRDEVDEIAMNRNPYIVFSSAAGVAQLVIGLEHEYNAGPPETRVESFGFYVHQPSSGHYAHFGVPAVEFLLGAEPGNPAGIVMKGASGGGISSWSYLEFNIAPSGAVSMRVDGKYLFSAGNIIATMPSTIAPIAKISILGKNTNAIQMSDMYLLNTDPAGASTWLGPETRVLPLAFPSAASSPADTWVTTPSNSTLNTVTDGIGGWTDGGDATYIATSAYPRLQLYVPKVGAQLSSQFTEPDDIFVSPLYSPTATSGKRVLGLSISGNARKTTQDSAYKLVFSDPTVSATVFEISPKIDVTEVNYEYVGPFVLEQNPVTEAEWTIADIYTNGLLGVKSVNPA